MDRGEQLPVDLAGEDFAASGARAKLLNRQAQPDRIKIIIAQDMMQREIPEELRRCDTGLLYRFVIVAPNIWFGVFFICNVNCTTFCSL